MVERLRNMSELERDIASRLTPELMRTNPSHYTTLLNLLNETHDLIRVWRIEPHNTFRTVSDQPVRKNTWTGDCGICIGTKSGTFCSVNCNSGHIFHCNCINTWLQKATTCPMCREHITQTQKIEEEQLLELKNGFGKTNKLKALNKEIKYLSTLK